MDLFEEIYTKDYIQNPIVKFNERIERPKVVFEELIVEQSLNLELTSLAQYFLAPFLLVDSNGVLDLSAKDKSIYDRIVREIAPHFNKPIKITSENQVMLRLQNIKERSKIHFLSLLKNQRLNAIVNDIYGKDSLGWGGEFPIKEYKVNLELVTKSFEHDILTMWSFFNDAFILNNGNFVLVPSQWVFDESFKDRIAVRAFASVCNSMTITVNTESNMVSSILVD
ncbi:hypothetical protein [Sporosarcina sp. FSL K6-3457]|uniref:hypothetical protein n=1 Tax=Sporosarcina sp. FSL K6-3457 TaxID=2978204 RepID=UPI0030F5946F